MIVTGATGTLGRAICHKYIRDSNLISNDLTVLAGCRDVHRGETIYASYPNVFTFECKLHTMEDVQLPPLFSDRIHEFDSVILYNNAALYLEGICHL